jgi:DNA-binding NtrC family response regulator
VDLAVNGLEAIQKSKETPYNVILINIPLPDMESEQLLDLINGEVQTTRKIVVTGCRSMKSAVAALNQNTNAYLIKPLSLRSF